MDIYYSTTHGYNIISKIDLGDEYQIDEIVSIVRRIKR